MTVKAIHVEACRRACRRPFLWRALAALLTIVAWTGAARAAAPPALAPLLAGSELDYPPFSIVHKDGRADGFAVELMRAALSKMGREVTFRTGPWSEVRGWLERGEVDALPLVGRTPEREALFDFTVPYLTMHGAIVVRRDTTDVRTLLDLHGRRVGVMAGDNAEEFLRREDRGFEIVATPTFTDAFHALAAGRCDAVVIQRLVAIRLLEETGLDNLMIIDRPIHDFAQAFCFAVQAGDRDTLAILNEGLALAVADGTQRRLHAKWFAALELPSDRPIVIGGDHNYPPFEFLDEKGRPAGYNVDLVRAVAEATGLDIRIRLGSWPEMLQALERGEIDAMQGMFYSPERGETFDFSQAHLVNHCVAVVRKEEVSPPATVADLAGKRIVVQAGDIMHDFCRQNGLTNHLAVVDSQEIALRELAAGKHDCALVARMTAFYWIEQAGWDNLAVGSKALASPEYGFAVPHGSRALLAQLSEGLTAISNAGEYRRIHEKWMGVYDEQFALGYVLKYVALVAGPLLLIALLASLWSWGLRRQVARRTAELAALSHRHQAMIEQIPDIVMEVDARKVYVWANADGYAFFGDDVIGNAASHYFIGEQDTYRILEPVFEGNESVVYVESLQRRRDGEVRLLAWWCRVLKNEAGHVIGAISTARDITERKRHEARIEHLNRVLRALRDVNQLITHENDRDALLRRSCEILISTRGYSSAWVALHDADDKLQAASESGIGDAFDDIKAAMELGDWPLCYRQAREAADGLVVLHDTYANCETCALSNAMPDTDALAGALRHGGHGYGVLVVSLPAAMADDPEEQSLFRELVGDVAYALYAMESKRREHEEQTERENLQSQLTQAQKMESIGRLAGGVAHDFNNLLMGIMGYADLCRDAVGIDHPAREWLDAITHEAERSAHLTRQLLAFARKQTVVPRVLDLNDAVGDMLKMLRRLIGENIDLAWEPGAALWPVKLDPGQIDQILANLCVNARDAIDGVGKITIETENVSIQADYCEIHAEAAPGTYVMLAVSDTGCGMDPETLANIFEPFFTTNPPGEGTGLGLATVYGIVKQNNGFVNVYSEPGAGATFRIYLPRVADALSTLPVKPETTEISGGSESILLVEDEASIRITTGIILEQLGYRVVAAEDPADALRKVAAFDGMPDLLITDVVMPGMNGRELARHLSEIYPGLKVLYMSGYTANGIVHQGILEEGVQFLSKPVDRDTLARKVRAVLEAEERPHEHGTSTERKS